jgi:hypothetical protein
MAESKLNPRGFYWNKEDKESEEKEMKILRAMKKVNANRRTTTNERKKESVEKIRDLTRLGNPAILAKLMAKYLADMAEGKNGPKANLTTEEAFHILYRDKLAVAGVKPEDLPGVVKDDKGKIVEPVAKILPLGSREMSEHLKEKLNRIN